MHFLSAARDTNALLEKMMDTMCSFEVKSTYLCVSGLISMVEPLMDSVGATVPVIIMGVTVGMTRCGVGGRHQVV